MRVVIFDLDGTLTHGDSFLPFLYYCARQFGIRAGSLFKFPYYAALYFVGIINNAALKEAFLGVVLKGQSARELQTVARQFAEKWIETRTNKELVRTLRTHQQEGHRVLLATASFDLYVKQIAERLGIVEVVCTSAEVESGILTGKLCGNNCYGLEKVRRLDLLLKPGILDSAICYTDHYSDLPLLQRVQDGFLVNPNLMTRLRLRGFRFSDGSGEIGRLLQKDSIGRDERTRACTF